MKIGIFGGSFNPPHKMHESIALQLLEKNYLDKIIFVPTSNFYPKASLISDEQRYEMLEILTKGNKNISLSKYEFGRLTYTCQTLEYFKNEYPKDEIYFICGSDNLKEMDTWREYEKILSCYKVIVVARDNDMELLLDKYSKYQDNIIVADISRNYLSSTLIREYLEKKDYDKVKDYINSDVLDYIIKNNLYEGELYD